MKAGIDCIAGGSVRMRQAIRDRISRRTFTEEVLQEKEIKQIKEKILQLNQESGLTVEFRFDGREVFAARSKSYGLFKNVCSLVIMKGPASDPALKEKIGYYGEKLVLDLTDMGLGTCWVAGTFDRKLIEVPGGEEMYCVIPVGHIEKVTLREKMLRSAVSKKRKSVAERLTGAADAPRWVTDAMEAVQLAPSAVNSQHPIFHFKEGKVTADVVDNSPTDLIDLGIAKRNFAEAAGGQFEMGNGGAFCE